MDPRWEDAKHLLLIRLDNMGDVIMTTPAIRALKIHGKRLTLLTSSMGKGITKYIPEIDDVIESNLQWVKVETTQSSEDLITLAKHLKKYQFDGAIIFTTFSQNPLPSAMLTYLANIPLRLGYCRENPYSLLTDWVPDTEPLETIQHEVVRQLRLLRKIGIETDDDELSVTISEEEIQIAWHKLNKNNVDAQKKYIIMHPGVSEQKRQVPAELFVQIGKQITLHTQYSLLITGVRSERQLAQEIASGIGKHAVSLAGELSLGEFIATVKHSSLVLSVNTGTMHIASAFKKPTVVLYATTNPQHTPWKTKSKIWYFDVPAPLQSRNQLLVYANKKYFPDPYPPLDHTEISKSIIELVE